MWDGVVTADEFLTHMRRMISDPDWPSSRRIQISDMQSASADATIDQSVLRHAAFLLGEHPDKLANAKVAIIAGGEFMKASSLEGMLPSASFAMIVFNSLDTACTWLGLEFDETQSQLQELRAFLRNPPIS